MRENDIDVLTLQETHLDEERTKELNLLFDRQLLFISSIDPDKPNAKGVAFVLNKKSVKWAETRHRVLEPGRALIIKIPWYDATTISVLNVYAPNNPRSNETFWRNQKAHWNIRPLMLEPSIILGDTNIVEEAIDCLPAHTDPPRSVNALLALKSCFDLADGWRRENPVTLDFTFQMQNRPIQSRIDRIYVKEDLIPFSWNWKIKRTAVNTDHAMTQMTLIHPRLPHIGKGRYAMPALLTKDAKQMKVITELGRKHQANLKLSVQERRPDFNLQTLHKAFKTWVMEKVRRYSKALKPKILKEKLAPWQVID